MSDNVTLLFGSSKEDQVLQAGYITFGERGFQKTRMEDVAKTAEMSRPALYQYFKGKKELFRALGERMQLRAEERVNDVLCLEVGCREKVRAMFGARDVWLFSLLLESPHGREFASRYEELTPQITGRYRDRFRDQLLQVIREGVRTGEVDLKTSGLPVEEWTDTLIRAVRGAETADCSVEELIRRIDQILMIFFPKFGTP